MKDILFIVHFTQMPSEAGNERFYYIAKKLCKDNTNVEIVTTTFSHATKRHRNVIDESNRVSYKLTMIQEPGYKKNVSIMRFYSHYRMGRNLKKYLKNRRRPDIIYCSVPSLDAAIVAAKYAMKNNIRFILDVQDLWPEAFKMVFDVPVISNVFFNPMYRQANYIYAAADEIIAVSQTYADRALKVNKKCKEAHIIFLGTELESFDRLASENKTIDKTKDEQWLAYIGTLGHSYDIICVIDALKILQNKGIMNIKFVVMGDGPLKSKFEDYAKDQEINAMFTGRLNYGEMAGILRMCDIAVNPIMPGSAGSVINKVGDYAAAELPVLNTQECLEYRRIVEDYQAGLNCKCNDAVDIAENLLKLYENETLRKTMGQNNRRLAEDRFDRKQTYKKIVSIINN